MQHLRQTDYRRTPWKNGGGETLQVAISPVGATIDDFDWRISLSAVTRDGALSAFPGVDRTLCLIAGAAIDLWVDGTKAGIVAPHGCHSFRGEATCFARLPMGPIVDLNVMTRRASFAHRVMAVGQGALLRSADAASCWFVASRDSVATSGRQAVRLAAQDALRLDSGETAALSVGAGWLVELTAV